MREIFNVSQSTFLEDAAKRFSGKEIPLKIRKLELLKEIGLPVKEGRYYERGAIDALREDLAQQFDSNRELSFVIRVACEPDKLSMPSFRIDAREGIEQSIQDLLKLIEEDHSIQQVILRPFISPSKIQDRIAGRLSFMGDTTTTKEILELYRGAETTGVLNVVDPQNPKFRSFTKRAGEFMKPSDGVVPKNGANGTFSEEDIKNVYRQLELCREKMDALHEVVAISKKSVPEKTPLTFEFSYLDGDFWYTDFD